MIVELSTEELGILRRLMMADATFSNFVMNGRTPSGKIGEIPDVLVRWAVLYEKLAVPSRYGIVRELTRSPEQSPETPHTEQPK